MTESAISVQLLSKKYTIGGNGQRYLTLRDAIAGSLKNPFQKILQHHSPPEIWALKDVSFEVERGEVVGIIGRNGAGKTTLLKILSRITPPTDGCVEINGRVGSLLEVGTGFHPELTGRENIFMSGSILGMKKKEIEEKFDAIVKFSEVEPFIETPIKHYSSGMAVRLAFAVAAHLEPEILLVDEVLAVGDLVFQKKCLNKMEEVGKEGRTVIFVSHNMPSITRLCPRTILIDHGRILMDGPSYKVVSTYLQSEHGTSAERVWEDIQTAPGNNIVRLMAVRILDQGVLISEAIDIRHEVWIEMEYEVLEGGHIFVPNFHFYNDDGVCVFITHDIVSDWRENPRPVGRYRSNVIIPGNFLSEGTLIVSVACASYIPLRVHFHERDVIAFQVIDSLDGDSARGDYAGIFPGVVRPMLTWTTKQIAGEGVDD